MSKNGHKNAIHTGYWKLLFIYFFFFAKYGRTVNFLLSHVCVILDYVYWMNV